jgi:hypothetical protein
LQLLELVPDGRNEWFGLELLLTQFEGKGTERP